jgi:hypothetical protein
MHIENLTKDGAKTGRILASDALDVMLRQTEGKLKFTKLNEKIITTFWGLRFKSNSFIFKAFNRKVVQLVESGIADVIVKKHMYGSKNSEKANDEQPALTLQHLGVWFIALAAFCSFAILCFFTENIIAKVLRSTRNTKVKIFNSSTR